MYDAIYGDQEIISRIDELSVRPFQCETYTGAINAVPDSDGPVRPIIFNEGLFSILPVSDATVNLKAKRVFKEGEEEIRNMKTEKPPKLVIPLSRRNPERVPKSTRSLRTKFVSVVADVFLNKTELLKIDAEEKALLPLHYFDEECCDLFVAERIARELERNELTGYSLYSYDNDNLEWRQCNVVGYKNGMFQMTWPDAPDRIKDIHRISLRFHFDDPERFEARRANAMRWRKEYEQNIRFWTYLYEQVKKSPVIMGPGFVNPVLKKLPEEVKSSEKLTSLIAEIVEDAEIGARLNEYVTQCKDSKRVVELTDKGLPVVHLYTPNTRTTKKLDPHRVNCIRMCTPRSRLRFQNLMDEIRSKPLYEKDYSKFEPVTYLPHFIDTHLVAFNESVEFVTKTSTFVLFGLVRDMLGEDRVPDVVRMTLEMADLIIMDTLEDHVVAEMQSFVDDFANGNVKFPLQLDVHLNIVYPLQKDVEEAGARFIDEIYRCFNNKLTSMHFMRDKEQIIELHDDYMRPFYDRALNHWYELVGFAYSEFEKQRDEIRAVIDCIPLYELNSVKDVLQNDGSLDLNLFEARIRAADAALTDFRDKFDEHVLDVPFLHVDITRFVTHIDCQVAIMKEIGRRAAVSAIYGLITSIEDGIVQLKRRCQRDPETVEEYYEKHVLLSDLKSNFGSINKDLDDTFVLFDFLEFLYYDSKVNISHLYYLKIELYQLLKRLPEFLKKEEEEYKLLLEKHKQETDDLQRDCEKLNSEMDDLPFKVNRRETQKYLEYLDTLDEEFGGLKDRSLLAKKRDEMMSIEIREYPLLDTISYKLSLYKPFWRISQSLEMEVEQWMGVPFTQLSAEQIIKTVHEWQVTMLDICTRFKVIVPGNEGKRSVLELGKDLLDEIDIVIGHIPIVQHLCNPRFRSRHWSTITEIAGFDIGPNEGLTWHWLVESNIEERISEIALISHNANMEYKIERALAEMCDELRTVSVSLRKGETGTRLGDTTPVFEMLAKHQQQIQKLFVAPYIKPFLCRTKEYDVLTQNLRQILAKTLDAQASINDLAPALVSEDVKNQSAAVSGQYENSLGTFNSVAGQFGDSSSLFQLISNPRYFAVMDNLKGSLEVLKDDLTKILEEKKKSFPRFRLLSDAQLTEVLSHSHQPSVIAHHFGNIYPCVKRAVFEDRDRACVGLESTNGEFFKFSSPFAVTPGSIETLFQTFDTSISMTLKSHLSSLGSKTEFVVTDVASKVPTQVAVLFYRIRFTTAVEKVFDGIAFVDNRDAYRRTEFQRILDDLDQSLELLQCDPVMITTMNLAMLFTEEKRIVKGLLERGADRKDSYEWIRHIRYYMTGTNETNTSVTVAIGPYTYPYGFEYIGNDPITICNEKRESIFMNIMIALSEKRNAALVGPAYFDLNEIVHDFSKKIGKNLSVHLCCTTDTKETVNKIIDVAEAAGNLLMFHNLRSFSGTLMCDMIRTLLPTTKNRSVKQMVIATYELRKGEAFPEEIMMYFRPIYVSNCDYEDSLVAILKTKNMLTDVNLRALSSLTHEYASNISSPFHNFFSVANISNLMVSTKHTNLCDILCSQIDENMDRNGTVVRHIMELCQSQTVCMKEVTDLPVIPEDAKPVSEVLNEIAMKVIECAKFHRDIIIVGDELTGKSKVIEACAAAHGVKLWYINPYAQNFRYLSDSKGLLANYLADDGRKWIVMDGTCHSQWMDVLATTNCKRDAMIFGDGTRVLFEDSFRFIFETDSIVHSTPSIMAQCALISIPNNAITYRDHFRVFMETLKADPRFTEPLSATIIGTSVKINAMFKDLECFIAKLLPPLIDNYASDSVSVRYASKHFFTILQALLTVHYLSEFKISAFNLVERKQLVGNLENHAIFAAVWSFGALTDGEQRRKFEYTLRETLPDHNLPKNKSIFEYYFEPTTSKWNLWEDMGTNNFYDQEISVMDIEPEFILMPPTDLLSTLFLSDCMLSQRISVFIDTDSKILQRVIVKLASNTTYASVNYQPIMFQCEPNFDDMTLRGILDQGLSGIRNGTRSVLRMPLIGLHKFDCNVSSFTELLRYALTHETICDLKIFSEDVLRGLAFVIAGNSRVPKSNKRLKSGFAIARISDSDREMRILGISQAIELMFGVESFSKQLGELILDTTTVIFGRFNHRHIMKALQKAAIAYGAESSLSFTDVISVEMCSEYLPHKRSDETLARLNMFARSVAKITGEPVVDLFARSDEIITNVFAKSFQIGSSVGSLTREPETIKMNRSNSVAISSKSLTCLISKNNACGHFITPTYTSKCMIDPSLSETEKFSVIKIGQPLVTPRTNIVIVSDLPDYAEEMVVKTCELLEIQAKVFNDGDNLFNEIHNMMITAGKTEKHVTLVIKESSIYQQDVQLMQNVLSDLNVFGLFEPTEVLEILTDIYCEPEDEDPFREETMESRDNYHVLVKDFMRKCADFFHITIVSHCTGKFSKYCTVCEIPACYESFISRFVASNLENLPCSIDKERMVDLLVRIWKSPTLCRRPLMVVRPIMIAMMNLFSKKFTEAVTEFEERVTMLEQLSVICDNTKRKLDSIIASQTAMEEEVVTLGAQIDEYMVQTKAAEAKSKAERKAIEEEEHVLKQQEQQASQLRKESEEVLAESQSIMHESMQELRSLNARDLAVIKSMNHPPRGVFLVVKAVVILMGIHVEGDKADLDLGQQPSWIAGKKLLIDSGVIGKLMGSSIENLTPEIINALQPILSDPNFQPNVIVSSSTAAKSICNYIHAIIPYYNAMKVCQQKQDALHACEVKLMALRDKHDDAIAKLEKADAELHEYERKSNNLLVKKVQIEESIVRSQESLQKSRETMLIMDGFFNSWADELKCVSEQRISLEQHVLFESLCFSLYAAVDENQRAALFDDIASVFSESGYKHAASRSDVLKSKKEEISAVVNNETFGAVTPEHYTENIIVMSLFRDKWFIVEDSAGSLQSMLMPVMEKKISVLAFGSHGFATDLLQCIQRNDFTVIHDYDLDVCYGLFGQIYHFRGSQTTIEVDGIHVLVPDDFQICFVVKNVPSDVRPFDSFYLNLNVDETVLRNDISCMLFNSLDTDAAHDCIIASKSIREAELELARTQKELEDFVINSGRDLLADSKCVKQFQNAIMTNNRVKNHVEKQTANRRNGVSHFQKFFDASGNFVSLFKDSSLDVDHYLAMVQEAVIQMTHSEGTIDDKIKLIFAQVSERVVILKASGLSFCDRVKLFPDCHDSDFDQTIRNINDRHPKSDILICPKSLESLVRNSLHKRAVIVQTSTELYRSLLMTDRAVVTSIRDCGAVYGRCTTEGKFLVTFCFNADDLAQIFTIVARLQSGRQISVDFRFIVMTNLAFLKNVSSDLLRYCDVVNTSGQPSIKHTLAMRTSMVPFTSFEVKGCPPSKFRRFMLLLAFFEACVHQLMVTIFQVSLPAKFPLLVELARQIPAAITGNIEMVRDLLINTVYLHLPQRVIQSLYALWDKIFTRENFEPAMITIAEKYQFPVTFGPDSLSKLYDLYPCIDSDHILGFPEGSSTPWKENCIQQWSGNSQTLFITEDGKRRGRRVQKHLDMHKFGNNECRRAGIAPSKAVFVISETGFDLGSVTVVNGVFNESRIHSAVGATKVDHVFVTVAVMKDSMIQIPVIHGGSFVGSVYAESSATPDPVFILM